MFPKIAKAIDLLARAEFVLALVALAAALGGNLSRILWALAFPALVLLASLVVVSGCLFALDAWLLRRDMKAKSGGKLELREGTVRKAQRAKPNEPCPCGSGRKVKRCCREAAGRPGMQLGNGMRLVGSTLRKTS